MCSVSMVTDNWKDNHWPQVAPQIFPWHGTGPYISRDEFERLKVEVEKLKEELKKARQQDIDDNAPLCAHKDSVDLVRQLAEILNVDLEDVFDGHEKS